MSDKRPQIHLLLGGESDCKTIITGLLCVSHSAKTRAAETYAIAEGTLEGQFFCEQRGDRYDNLWMAHADLIWVRETSLDAKPRPACTNVPPTLAMKIPVCIDTSAPLASNTTSIALSPRSSTPRVSFRRLADLREYAILDSPSWNGGGWNTSVAAYVLAKFRRLSTISTAMILDAPMALATAMQRSPIGPQPKTTID